MDSTLHNPRSALIANAKRAAICQIRPIALDDAEAGSSLPRERAPLRYQELTVPLMSPDQDTTTAFSESEPAFYRLADVIRITALSRSSIYRRIAAGEFPPQVSLGGRATGWRRAALQEWISDPSGFRPLATCDVQRTSSGARVRHVSSDSGKLYPRRG